MLEITQQQLPEFAKDVRLNLIKVLDLTQTDGLTEQQIIGSALAVAYHLGDKLIVADLLELCKEEKIQGAAKLVASLMAMTNIYYRFIHLSEHEELTQVPAGLRMQGMMNPGIDRLTFEILSLAVSILNGCGACISSHTRQLRGNGVSSQGLARIGRIAAVIHAAHVCLNL